MNNSPDRPSDKNQSYEPKEPKWLPSWETLGVIIGLLVINVAFFVDPDKLDAVLNFRQWPWWYYFGAMFCGAALARSSMLSLQGNISNATKRNERDWFYRITVTLLGGFAVLVFLDIYKILSYRVISSIQAWVYSGSVTFVGFLSIAFLFLYIALLAYLLWKWIPYYSVDSPLDARSWKIIGATLVIVVLATLTSSYWFPVFTKLLLLLNPMKWKWWYYFPMAVVLGLLARWFVLLYRYFAEELDDANFDEIKKYLLFSGVFAAVLIVICYLDRYSLVKYVSVPLFHWLHFGTFTWAALWGFLAIIVTISLVIFLFWHWIASIRYD